MFFTRIKQVSALCGHCGQLNIFHDPCLHVVWSPCSASTSVAIPTHQNELCRHMTYGGGLMSVIPKVVSKLKLKISPNE